MSTPYARLIELALGTSPEQPILAIVSNLAEGQRAEHEVTGDLSFPREYLPAGADVRFLPADEHYVDRVKTLLTEIRPVRVFLAPPLRHNRDLPGYLRLQYPRMNLESIALQAAIESLPTGSQVAVTLPAAFLQNESSRSVRANVFAVASPQTVLVHLPSLHEMGLPVHSAFRMTTVIVEVGAGGSLLRFFRGEAASATGDLVADFTRLLRQGGGRTRYGYVIREGLPVDAPLLYDLYDPKVVDRRRSLAALGQVQRLGDLADLLLGINVVAEAGFLEDQKSGQGIPVIEGRNIGSDGRFMLEEIRYRARISDDRQLREGDLCIQTICGPNGRIRIAEVTKGVLPAATGRSVLTLRLQPRLSLTERQTLIAYLRSPHAAEQLNALRGEAMTIAVRHLADLSVPLLDGALRTALNDIDGTIGQFQEWIAEAKRTRDALFEFSDPGKDGGQLHALGRLSRRRCDAARLVTDLRHRMRTQYPHPIAFRWRTVEVARPDLEGLQNVLEGAEVAVCYLAFMAIVMSRAVPNFRISYVGEIGKRMGSPKPHGTNMGDWMAIVREVRGSEITRRAETTPFGEIASIDEETDQALQRLSDVRNDVAHGRGPKGAAIPTVFEQCRDDLEVMLGGIEFVTEYPLRYIERASRDTILGWTTYQFRELMGDHILVPLSTATVSQSELEESLYLVDREGLLCLLRPFLNLRECPKCGRRATFYLDRYLPKEDKCFLKSMECGHTATDPEIVVAYRRVGLLPSQ